MEFLNTYPWVLAFAIFFARITDVSLGTVRTILIFRGRGLVAAAIGFVEILIWLAAAGQVFKQLDAWYLAVAYAGGFAAGNAVGVWVESKLALGTELVRVISHDPAIELAPRLRAEGYSVTELAGKGEEEQPVEVLLVVDERRRIKELLTTIARLDPAAIWTISDVKQAHAPLEVRETLPADQHTPLKKK